MSKKASFVVLGLFGLVMLALLYFFFRNVKSGNLGILTPDRISVYSSVEGVEAEIGNKAELERYLDELGFWNGILTDNNTSGQILKPEKLIIHITDNEYKETWFRQEDGSHQFSARAEEEGKNLHLYLGFNKELLNKSTDRIMGSVDFIIFEAIYQRTSGGVYNEKALSLRNAKVNTDPFIKLTLK